MFCSGGGKGSLASDVISQLKQNISNADMTMCDIKSDIEIGITSMDKLLEEYEWKDAPDLRMAFEYYSGKNTSDEAKRSWGFFYGYKDIMWLSRIARDYMISASEKIDKFYEGLEGGDLA